MVIARWILLVLGLAAIVSFVLYVATGQVRFRRYGVTIVKWVVVAGLVFFASLAAQRLLGQG